MLFPRIRELRVIGHYTQAQLADHLFIRQATYSEYESGKISVPIEAMIRIADFYDVSLDYLVTRTDDRTRPPKPKE